MLFKVLTKAGFRQLVELVLEANEIIAPKLVGTDDNDEPIHQYLPIEEFEEMCLGYETTEYSAKTYFLPYKETLSSYSYTNGDWTQEINYRLKPRYLFGLHACDINALLKLDKVMARDFFPSPYYISRRKNTFIVGIDHEPCKGGFCRSVGADQVTHGFDLFLTDLGDRYFVAIDSDRGFNLLKNSEAREITDADTRAYLEVRRNLAEKFEDHNFHNLQNLMDLEFDSPVWQKWGEKCLSCGSCAMVCPTCYCYGVHERVTMDNAQSDKIKNLYSCNLYDFAMVAGGHNFRPERRTRLKYRYYHQHRGFAETFEAPMCVGCNRCGRTCLADIQPVDVIRDLQAEGNA